MVLTSGFLLAESFGLSPLGLLPLDLGGENTPLQSKGAFYLATALKHM